MSYTRTTIECYSCEEIIPVISATAIRGWPYCEDCVADIEEATLTSCRGCGNYFDPEDVISHQGDWYCEDCFNDMQTMCEECDCQLFLEDTEACKLVDGQPYCRTCYDDIFASCSECGEIVDRNDCREVPVSLGESDYLCEDCWDEQCCECEECGSVEWIDECVLIRNAYGTRGALYECDGCRSRSTSFWHPANFRPTANTYDRVGSERCFGIELEYSDTPSANAGVPELEWFGRKGEHCGSELCSSILSGDVGLNAAERLADFANDNNWRYTSQCGYHLHLDMRDETPATMRSLAYAYRKTYHIWKRFVSTWRADNCDYCHAPAYSATQIRSTSINGFETWAHNSQRFLYVNWNALGDHETVEIRLHAGTHDSKEVTNWVIVHARFVDWAVGQTLDQIDDTFDGTVDHDFQALGRIWGDDNLTTYYCDKADEHEHPITRQNASREAVAV